MSSTVRHALVCGASSGIGRGAALALAGRGLDVTVLARSGEKLRALVPEMLSAGAPAARHLVADHDDRAGLGRAVERLLADRGPVHVLVNNSGGPPPGALLEASDDDFLAAFGRHLLANHLLVRATLPGMREAGWGRIVNVISVSVYEPLPNLGVSNTIRGAVASWAKTLSLELPPGVTVNNVLPGLTATDRLFALVEELAQRTGQSADSIQEAWRAGVPEGRLGRVEELGEVIAFLASDAASYVRGVSLPVDGGRLHGI